MNYSYSNISDTIQKELLKGTNGRVDISQPNLFQFELFKHPGINYNNKANYRGGLQGNIEETTLSRVFFSKENMNIIQNGIRAGVYKLSKGLYNVARADETNLKIIMRSLFLQYSANQPTNIREQVQALNQIVLDYCVPSVLNEAESYLKYKNDVSTLATPHALPTSTTNKGNKILELQKWF